MTEEIHDNGRRSEVAKLLFASVLLNTAKAEPCAALCRGDDLVNSWLAYNTCALSKELTQHHPQQAAH